MKLRAPLTLVLLAACGGGGGGNNNDGTQIDAPKQIDAPPGGKTFHISGTASQQAITGSMPAPDVIVTAYANSDEQTGLAMATSDAQGNYMITVNSSNTTLDGFLKATKAGNADTYLYPPAPLTADFMMASINELDTNLFGFLDGTSECNNAGKGMIVLEVFDTAMMPVAGVAVTASPAAGKTGYSAAGSPLPDFAGAATMADGRAYLCQLPAGSVTLTATKTGATFKPTTLKVHPGAFTTTIVSE